MQIYAPGAYYGYQRAAQVHLVRSEFAKACRTYCQGFQNVCQQDGLDLLRTAVGDAQSIFEQALHDYVQACQLQKAQQVAVMIICLQPALLSGYLRSGKLYEMQGNAKRAMEVYNQGMAYVSASDIQILVEHKINIQQQSALMRRCDFIMQAPPEIVPNILQNLTTCDLMNCMDVSKGWKERVQQCYQAWRVVTVSSCDRSIDVAAIQKFKSFVQKIKFTGYYAANELYLIDDLLTAITDGDFVNLIDIDLDLNGGPGPDLSYYYEIVERVKLTGLSITTFTENGRLTPLREFLELSPHLKYLEYDTNDLGFFAPYEVRTPLEPSLVTHLELHNIYVTSRQKDTLFHELLLPGFPRLVQLHISECGPRDLRAITKLCPNLRWLSIGNNYQCETVPSHTIRDDMPMCLQYINIDITDIYTDDITEIITRNHHTLKELRLKHTYRNNTSTKVGTAGEGVDLPVLDHTSPFESPTV
ncbi:hypothetical protein BJV82DRAFT_379846 [Fennellomyces sp. T-0311]|nr:hypothetical protein BJV82DRAFT_379846 [Fennellomyces sp. T-0311]